MSDKYLYREVQTADRGRGYGAIDLLAFLAYLQAIGAFLFTAWALTQTGFDPHAVLAGIGALVALAVECLGIYVLRLALRAVLVVRDSTAHDQIDQDARYKTSSST